MRQIDLPTSLLSKRHWIKSVYCGSYNYCIYVAHVTAFQTSVEQIMNYIYCALPFEYYECFYTGDTYT